MKYKGVVDDKARHVVPVMYQNILNMENIYEHVREYIWDHGGYGLSQWKTVLQCIVTSLLFGWIHTENDQCCAVTLLLIYFPGLCWES